MTSRIISPKDILELGSGGMRIFLPIKGVAYSGKAYELTGTERDQRYSAVGDMLNDLAATADILAMSPNAPNVTAPLASLNS